MSIRVLTGTSLKILISYLMNAVLTITSSASVTTIAVISQTTSHVNLLTVVDSSSGITLGKCSDITDVSDRVSTDPHFPLLELDSTDSSHLLETRLWTVSPCADFICQNNGTCVVTHEESAACLCRDGFSGVNCEVEECGSVPCQNGGSCRSQDGEAHCDCAPPFTGILCESVVAICEPACANGECVIQDDRITCECMQGFVGSVCNVVDVCLGDTACSIFGQQAKCIIDKSSYMLISSTLYNASYECKCPHPIDGEYVDCLALHLSTSVFESFPASVSPVALFLTTKTEKTSFPTEGFATEEGKQGVGKWCLVSANGLELSEAQESGHPKLSSRRPTTDAPVSFENSVCTHEVNSTPPKFSAPEFVSEAFTNLYLHQVDTDTGREVGTQTKVVNLLPLLRSLRSPTPLPPIPSTVLLLDFQIL
ncbi:EGF-like domain protein, partial [Necator americanus]